MKLYLVLLMSMFAASRLAGATIVDVTNNNTAQLQTGDTLAFEILSGSFSRNATTFGLSPNPTEISFALVFAPIAGSGGFSAWLGSADGSVSVDIGKPLSVQDGSFSSSGYQGAVSTLQGFFQLSPLLSQGIFAGGPAILTLRNDGPGVTLDLAPYTLRQDLFVSLAGGPLSVGGLIGGVTLGFEDFPPLGHMNFESFDTPLGQIESTANQETASTVPEPDSSILVLAGGGALCGFSVLLNRISRRGK
jgi:hypothetical protein